MSGHFRNAHAAWPAFRTTPQAPPGGQGSLRTPTNSAQWLVRMHVADVIVIGGGNAGICAALTAAESGARVTVLERAPAEKRGGNSFVTAGAFRFPYRGVEDVAQIVSDPALATPDAVDIGQYTEDEFFGDMLRLTNGRADPELSRVLVSQAFPTVKWLRGRGVEFVLAYDRQSFLVDGRHRFWGGLIVKTRGEGPGLIDALFRACEVAGVTMYEGPSYAFCNEKGPQTVKSEALLPGKPND